MKMNKFIYTRPKQVKQHYNNCSLVTDQQVRTIKLKYGAITMALSFNNKKIYFFLKKNKIEDHGTS